MDWEKEKAPENQVSGAFIGWLRARHEDSMSYMMGSD